jgi:glutamate dehydrogenase (NADP+)
MAACRSWPRVRICPLTRDAERRIEEAGVRHAPGKASNAGGVAVSGLEMSQNSHRQFDTAEQVDAQLKEIMRTIHAQAAENGRDGNRIDYARGANIAAYRKVADAITAMGAI